MNRETKSISLIFLLLQIFNFFLLIHSQAITEQQQQEQHLAHLHQHPHHSQIHHRHQHHRRYGWFTAVATRIDRYHLTLQAALESVFQCCSHLLYPIVLYDGDYQKAPVWLRLLNDKKAILLYPYHLSWEDKLTTQQRTIAPSYFRMEIPWMMDTILKMRPFLDKEYVLYTDADVLFYQMSEFIKPPLLTIGPEASKGKKDNNGVMFMNLTALTPLIEGYTQYASQHGDTGDQVLTLAYFRDNSTLLPDTYNWKPYWGINPDTNIIHTHGTKVNGCLEEFLYHRYESNEESDFGSHADCGHAKPYGGVQKHSYRVYGVDFEDQMRSYLKFTRDLYRLHYQFDQRILQLNEFQEITLYSKDGHYKNCCTTLN